MIFGWVIWLSVASVNVQIHSHFSLRGWISMTNKTNTWLNKNSFFSEHNFEEHNWGCKRNRFLLNKPCEIALTSSIDEKHMVWANQGLSPQVDEKFRKTLAWVCKVQSTNWVEMCSKQDVLFVFWPYFGKGIARREYIPKATSQTCWETKPRKWNQTKW